MSEELYGREGSLAFGVSQTINADATEAMRIDSNGNVGINTTNPDYKLDVEGDISLVGAGENYAIMSPISQGMQIAVGDPADIATPLVTFDGANQRVGIGTTSPGSKLEVNGTFKATGTGAIQGRLSVGTSSSSDIDMLRAGGNYITATNAAGVLYFRTVSDIRMAILANGNVGIKTTNPTYLLDVRDGTLSGAIARFSAVNAHVIIESSSAGPAVLHFKPNITGNKSGQFKVTAGNGYNFRWSNDASGTGEVTYMKLDTSTTGGGDLTVKGDIIAYGAPSDERYKENIKPIESALDKAVKLQGVTFDWKESDSILDIKEDIGFIAQDVQKVVPELVRENEDGKLSLRYQGVTPILLEAIKELKAEIDLLKSKPCNCNNCNCSI
jgi:hypothetical protein